MALFIESYSDEIPQIGEVLEVNNEDILLHWWDGTYWLWKALAKRRGCASVPWTELVERSNVLFEVSLTKSLELPKATQEKLHKAYEPLLAELNDEKL